jgi:hypothetical protein
MNYDLSSQVPFGVIDECLETAVLQLLCLPLTSITSKNKKSGDEDTVTLCLELSGSLLMVPFYQRYLNLATD